MFGVWEDSSTVGETSETMVEYPSGYLSGNMMQIGKNSDYLRQSIHQRGAETFLEASPLPSSQRGFTRLKCISPTYFGC